MKRVITMFALFTVIISTMQFGIFASGRIPGDVNGDDKIDGRDLIRLKQYLSGKDVTVIEDNADMNGDTRIDGRDAIRLAQYLAGQGQSDDPDPEYPPFDADEAIAQAKAYAKSQGYIWRSGMVNTGYGSVYVKCKKDMSYIVKRLQTEMDAYHLKGKNTFYIIYIGTFVRNGEEHHHFKVYYSSATIEGD